MLRDHGRTSKYEHDEIGYGERIDALQAAILAAKLPHLEDWTEARRRHARRYTAPARRTTTSSLPAEDRARRARLPPVRDPVLDSGTASSHHLKGAGIGAGIHYPIPLHRQPAYTKRGYGPVSLPHTERAAAEVLSLPMLPGADRRTAAGGRRRPSAASHG